MRLQIGFLNLPTKVGSRGFNWSQPKTISPVQCALFMLERETIRLVCTKEEVNKANPRGVLAVYQREGEFKGIYRELGTYQIAQWATEFSGAVNQKWRNEFQVAITDNAKPVCECENPDYIFFNSEILDYKTKRQDSVFAGYCIIEENPVRFADSRVRCSGSYETGWDCNGFLGLD